MSNTPIPDPRLQRRVRREGLQPNPSRESTLTPIERLFTATQARNQRIPSQEPTIRDETDTLAEETMTPAQPEEENQNLPSTPTQPPLPSIPGLDLQSLLLALSRQPAPSQHKKRYRGVKEPDLFSGGNPDELHAFIFQCQIFFRACEGEFREDSEKVFFAISYLRGVALDYFEPFINEPDPYQNLDFLEDWSAFVQKLSNIFGSYSPEDDDEDAIVAIPFPNDGKAVNYFVQFAKYQNRIRWDDRSLRKVVKDALPNRIRDELRFSHEDLSSLEGLRRAVQKINNDFWKRQQEDQNKFRTARTSQTHTQKAPRPEPSRLTTTPEGLPSSDKWFREGPRPPASASLSTHPNLSQSPDNITLGPDGCLTPLERQR